MSEPLRLDPHALKELRVVMDDEFDVLMTTFIHDSYGRVADLAASHLDWPALCRIAHAFKGSSSNVGALALAERCRELEDHCRTLIDTERVLKSERSDLGVHPQSLTPPTAVNLAVAENLIEAVRREQALTVKAIHIEMQIAPDT